MEKIVSYLAILSLLFFTGCRDTHGSETKAIVINSEQIVRLWDIAEKKELLGEPLISYSEIIDSSTKLTITQKISVQSFKLTIAIDEDGKPVKPSSDDRSARINNGTVFGTITCSSSCRSTTVGGGCETKGCDPIRGGCSSPECGSGCFSYSCTKTSTGFGFGFSTVLF